VKYPEEKAAALLKRREQVAMNSLSHPSRLSETLSWCNESNCS